ncbi:hypothetical protein CVAR21S_00667 [Corynebacterium variabile]
MFSTVTTLPGLAVGPAADAAAERGEDVIGSSPLEPTAEPWSGPGTPDSEVKVPPASLTMMSSAARSHRLTSGSAATSTVPSATMQ